MVGEKINRRAITVQMQCYNEAAAPYGEGQIRLVFWKPKLKYGLDGGLSHVLNQNDFNSFFDFDKINILKDIRLTIGSNISSSNVSLIKSWKMVFYDRSIIKCSPSVTPSLYEIPPVDRYYVAYFCIFNDIIVRWSTRMTFTDC